MLRDILSSRLVQGGLLFFVVVIVGTQLYSWHIRRSMQEDMARTNRIVQQLENKKEMRTAQDTGFLLKTETLKSSETSLETDDTERISEETEVLSSDEGPEILDIADAFLPDETTTEGEEVPVEAPYGVSPYGFGPFPEVPPDYPNQHVWSGTRLLTMQPEHELLSRVRIKLWNQGVRTVGAVFRMDYGRIFPTREDVVYIEWADSVAADGQMYVVRMLSSPATINQYEEDIYRGIFPPHLTIYEFPDGGIDPYEFLGSPR